MFLRTPCRTLLSLLFLAATSFACADAPSEPGGGGGGGGGGGSTTADVAGTWNWVVAATTSTCGAEPDGTWVITITQAGTGITASGQWGSDDVGPHEFMGTVTGNTVAITDVMYPEDGGDLSARHDVTLQSNGTLTGTETWSWTGPGGPCSGGTSNITATRQ